MSKPRKEVRNLLLMLSSGLLAAFIVVVALIFYFGSSGTYLLRDIVIAPDALEAISFTEGDARFVFNKIEFTQADPQGKGWGRYAVSKQSYAEFYHIVENQRSIPQLSDEIVNQFSIIAPSTLTLFVQTRHNRDVAQENILFQQVEFIDQENVFRVKLRDSNEDTWVYFSYPGIYKIVVELFAPQVDG